MSPSSEATKMCIGECYSRIKGDELDVPDYQRDYVWSKKQQQSYLESVSKGLPLFGPVINIDTESGKQWIMDGQNRLKTIVKFMDDEITFENENCDKVKYSELSDNNKRKFKNIKISYTETRDWVDDQCQEFFTAIQQGVQLKDGELIHARPCNPFTQHIEAIYQTFNTLFTNKAKDGGIGLSPSLIKRYGHYEIIGTIIHMTRTGEYPVRPGKTALSEFDLWGDEKTPTRPQRELCVKKATDCLSKYSDIIMNVPRLKKSVKKEEHLRLLYLIYKSGLYMNEWTDIEYTKIDNMLNKVLNKGDPVYDQIVLWGTGDVEKIYTLYLSIFNEENQSS